ncbi:Uncharacterized protein OBRU01_10689 [Operophtera brumata]|uniref:Uncharacterized protein n=1 Tax=Operophtera brumata TaxID=104452 RepID=A0A0L7L231_OPEBR|nr:Uncharacterized protein OBRU01_10689 [Operophtera brumata]
MKGHGELLSIFRKDLDRTGVMLVKDLEAIPSTLAMAFHYYCDEYNPLVKKNNQSGKKTTHAVIEKCLAQKWNGVPPDSIGPLLTRVVSVLIDVTSTF